MKAVLETRLWLTVQELQAEETALRARRAVLQAEIDAAQARVEAIGRREQETAQRVAALVTLAQQTSQTIEDQCGAVGQVEARVKEGETRLAELADAIGRMVAAQRILGGQIP